SDWAEQITLDLAPVMFPTDRAVPLGLVLTELVINANKYAYNGASGPIHIALVEDRARFKLTVSDKGGGKTTERSGFGTKMMLALVGQLSGELDFQPGNPGLRVVLSAPITTSPGSAVVRD
ncbi:MAG: sensor histidine kinase, partial [Afipia sp.]|nr:sensor histidine kinase [Afipia sp.]